MCRAAALAAILAMATLDAAAAGGRPTVTRQLDRVAYAVDGAESSHGRNPAMWHPDPAGPQGPMQVSAKAATDVGGGDRFDAAANLAIGRAYLAQLYRRYGDWADAIAAYNWGIGNLDNWIRAGRPADQLLGEVVNYLHRVLRDSGLCRGTAAAGETCGAQFVGGDAAAWRAALAAARESAPGAARWAGRRIETPFTRTLATAALLARQFGAEQTALEHRLSRGK
jgi:hypothetical protein